MRGRSYELEALSAAARNAMLIVLKMIKSLCRGIYAPNTEQIGEAAAKVSGVGGLQAFPVIQKDAQDGSSYFSIYKISS